MGMKIKCIIVCDFPSLVLFSHSDGSSCPPEMLFTASGSYSWQISFADSMATLPCPIGPANVSATRQCNAQGNWLDHDASLCLDEFDLILTVSVHMADHSISLHVEVGIYTCPLRDDLLVICQKIAM